MTDQCFADKTNESILLSTLADIRHRTGVGDKPMLTELASAIVHEHNNALHKEMARSELLRDELISAVLALRSYQDGDGSPNLVKEIINSIEQTLEITND